MQPVWVSDLWNCIPEGAGTIALCVEARSARLAVQHLLCAYVTATHAQSSACATPPMHQASFAWGPGFCNLPSHSVTHSHCLVALLSLALRPISTQYSPLWCQQVLEQHPAQGASGSAGTWGRDAQSSTKLGQDSLSPDER